MTKSWRKLDSDYVISKITCHELKSNESSKLNPFVISFVLGPLVCMNKVRKDLHTTFWNHVWWKWLQYELSNWCTMMRIIFFPHLIDIDDNLLITLWLKPVLWFKSVTCSFLLAELVSYQYCLLLSLHRAFLSHVFAFLTLYTETVPWKTCLVVHIIQLP